MREYSVGERVVIANHLGHALWLLRAKMEAENG